MSIILNSIQFIYFNLNVSQIQAKKQEFHVERTFGVEGKVKKRYKKKSDLKDREIIL